MTPSVAAVCTVVKSKVNILQNFVAFSEYMNFMLDRWLDGSFFTFFSLFQFHSALKINELRLNVYRKYYWY